MRLILLLSILVISPVIFGLGNSSKKKVQSTECDKYKETPVIECIDQDLSPYLQAPYTYDSLNRRGKEAMLLSELAQKKREEHRDKLSKVKEVINSLNEKDQKSYYKLKLKELFDLIKKEKVVKFQISKMRSNGTMKSSLQNELKVLQADKATLLMTDPLIGTSVLLDGLSDSIKEKNGIITGEYEFPKAHNLLKKGLAQVRTFLQKKDKDISKFQSELNVTLIHEAKPRFKGRRSRAYSPHASYLSKSPGSLNVIDYILGKGSLDNQIADSPDKYRICKLSENRDQYMEKQDENRSILTAAVNIAPFFLGPGAGLLTKAGATLASRVQWAKVAKSAGLFALTEGSLLALDLNEIKQKEDECTALRGELFVKKEQGDNQRAYDERVEEMNTCNEELANQILGFKSGIIISGLTLKNPLKIMKAIKGLRSSRKLDQFPQLKSVAGTDLLAKDLLASMASKLAVKGMSPNEIQDKFMYYMKNPEKLGKACKK